jgi:hypothetical protein
MPAIDLTLAVNYLPAVECMVKVTLLSCILCLSNVSEHFGAVPVMALMLNIDRALSSARIFDGNAVHYYVLLSWFVNTLRSTAYAPGAVLPVATFLWVAFAFLLVVEPVQVQEFFVLYGQGSGGRLKQVLPAVAGSFFVGLFCFLPVSVESCPFRVARSLAFATLCVAWVYVVAVWKDRPRGAGLCVFSSHALLARFAPVLYVNAAVAVVYCTACVGMMAFHYVQMHVVTVTVHQHVPVHSEPAPDTVVSLNTIREEDEEDLEALLRSAKMQQGC